MTRPPVEDSLYSHTIRQEVLSFFFFFFLKGVEDGCFVFFGFAGLRRFSPMTVAARQLDGNYTLELVAVWKEGRGLLVFNVSSIIQWSSLYRDAVYTLTIGKVVGDREIRIFEPVHPTILAYP